MSSTGGGLNSDTSKELYQIMRSCKEIEVSRENESAALASVMDSVSELTRLRTRRISLANERLPGRLRILVVFMSSVLVLGFALLGIVNPWVHFLVIASVAISVHLLHLIIEDLDHPFYGIWNIDKAPFVELQMTLEHKIEAGVDAD